MNPEPTKHLSKFPELRADEPGECVGKAEPCPTCACPFRFGAAFHESYCPAHPANFKTETISTEGGDEPCAPPLEVHTQPASAESHTSTQNQTAPSTGASNAPSDVQPIVGAIQPPPGHELLPADFLREHGAVAGMKSQHHIEGGVWKPCFHAPSTEDLLIYSFSAPLGTMAAILTPAHKGFRNVLPGWLAGLERKPEGLIWASSRHSWMPDPHRWDKIKERFSDGDFAYAVPISSDQENQTGKEQVSAEILAEDKKLIDVIHAAPAEVPAFAGSGQEDGPGEEDGPWASGYWERAGFHNPDNLPSPGEGWRFLVKGENVHGDDEGWFEQSNHQKGWSYVCTPVRSGDVGRALEFVTYRTRRPLPVSDWLPIAQYDREKHGEWVEGQWLKPSLHEGVRKMHQNARQRWVDEHGFIYFNGVPVSFRPLPTSAPVASKTVETDVQLLVEKIKFIVGAWLVHKDGHRLDGELKEYVLPVFDQRNEARAERDEAIAFATKVERGEAGFKASVDKELAAIAAMPLGKRHDECLSQTVARIVAERDTALASLAEMKRERDEANRTVINCDYRSQVEHDFQLLTSQRDHALADLSTAHSTLRVQAERIESDAIKASKADAWDAVAAQAKAIEPNLFHEDGSGAACVVRLLSTLRADKERLDWLEANLRGEGILLKPRGAIVPTNGSWAGLRAAVDAALNAEKGGGE